MSLSSFVGTRLYTWHSRYDHRTVYSPWVAPGCIEAAWDSGSQGTTWLRLSFYLSTCNDTRQRMWSPCRRAKDLYISSSNNMTWVLEKIGTMIARRTYSWLRDHSCWLSFCRFKALGINTQYIMNNKGAHTVWTNLVTTSGDDPKDIVRLDQ